MIADCLQLYLKYKGRKSRKIEAEMRMLGWEKFNRRVLYQTNVNGNKMANWINRFGWLDQLSPKDRAGLHRYRVGRSFPLWLRATMPVWKWNWKHQVFLYKHLKRVTAGKCKRLMIFMPPRHGKSELVTVRYAAWRLEMDPILNVIIGSYNQKLANRFSRKIKRVAEGRMDISRNRRAADEWETTAGGGVRAVGVGAGIAGFGGGLIIIDDPIRNRADAESKTIRDNVWDWFNDDIYTRLEPDAAVVLIQTRWHDDDLAGRLLQEKEDGGEDWSVVCLPALAEGDAETEGRGDAEKGSPPYEGGVAAAAADGVVLPPVAHSTREAAEGENHPPAEAAVPLLRKEGSSEITASPRLSLIASHDPLGRKEGEALCPDRYTREALLRIKRKLGAYSFAAMYQQRPMPREGGMFKREWFTKIIDKHPDALKWCRGYDLAVSMKTSADYTASFRCAKDKEGNLYIADGFRKRIEFPEQRRFAIDRMTAERDTNHGIELALHGKALMQELRRETRLFGAAFCGVTVDKDKHTRALSWANLAEEGKVYLVKGAWIDDFLDEVCRFTGRGDRHDDQVDAVSLAVQMIRKEGKGLVSI